MTKREAIDYYGSGAALARALGITRAAVFNWGDDIPSGRQFEIEVLTEGVLKAERHEKQSHGGLSSEAA